MLAHLKHLWHVPLLQLMEVMLLKGGVLHLKGGILLLKVELPF